MWMVLVVGVGMVRWGFVGVEQGGRGSWDLKGVLPSANSRPIAQVCVA